MARNARTKRLTDRGDQAAALKAKGFTNIDAWRQVTPGWDKLPIESQHSRSYEFFSHPLVVVRVNEALRHISVTAIDSHARFHTELMQDIEWSRQLKNPTAVAALQRVRGSSGTYLSEKYSIDDNRGLTDKQLLDRLAKLLPSVTPADLAAAVGKDGFVAPVLPRDGAEPVNGSKIN